MAPRSKTHQRKGRTDLAIERASAQKETRKAVTASERKRRAEANPPKKTRKKTKVEEPAEEQAVEDETTEEQPAQDKSEDEQSGSEESGSGSGDDDGDSDDDGEDADGEDDDGEDADGEDDDGEDEDGEDGEDGDGEDDDGEDDDGGDDESDEDYFPGGPFNLSLLKGYKSHVAFHLWKSYTEKDYTRRGDLKVHHHGRAFGNSSTYHKNKIIKQALKDYGLEPLLNCNPPIVSQTIVTAFVERWHPETSSFHMPFGDMSILLEDVANLLHIPVHGKSFTLLNLTRDEAVPVLCDQLGVTQEEAIKEIHSCRGLYVRYAWIKKLVETLAKKKKNTTINGERAAKAYLLRLVTCTASRTWRK